jgi:hypothetical protein
VINNDDRLNGIMNATPIEKATQTSKIEFETWGAVPNVRKSEISSIFILFKQ